jgi:hypothetical protein
MLCEPILSSYPTFSSNTPESMEAHPSPRVRRNLGVVCKASSGEGAMRFLYVFIMYIIAHNSRIVILLKCGLRTIEVVFTEVVLFLLRFL